MVAGRSCNVCRPNDDTPRALSRARRTENCLEQHLAAEVAQPQVLGGGADASDEPGVELAGREVGDFLEIDRDAALARDAAHGFSSSFFMPERVLSLAFRRSTVMRTSPGMTLRELGLTCIWPTVPRAESGKVLPMRFTSRVSWAAAARASLRSGIGVGPAREHVADGVDAHLEPGLAAPAREKLAPFAVGRR
jgi:hypothetical protein